MNDAPTRRVLIGSFPSGSEIVSFQPVEGLS